MNSSDGAEDFCGDVIEICSYGDYDKEEAKERASILWLLSKAFDGTIPSDLQEPFYRDHEHHRRLKPKIVHSLANAELYCLALANIYSDPNYRNIDHHGVIQALMRKGICLVESRDAPLTETVLVQTAPLKMAAHMAVIDGMISLYIKEVLIPDKVVNVVRGFATTDMESEMPSNPEEAAVLWINKCCISLELEIKDTIGVNECEENLPRIPVLQEISDISDGCSLAAVISFYCPASLNWQDICLSDTMTLQDSIYNIQLIKHFCCTKLPHQIDFLTMEDFLYIHPSIKENALVFVAELLFSFVIYPVSCVTRQVTHCESQEPSQVTTSGYKTRSNSMSVHKSHQVPSTSIPNLRSDSYGGSTSSLPELRVGSGSHSRESCDKMLTRKKSSSSNDQLQTSPQLHRTRSSGVVNGYKLNISTSSLTNSAENERLSGFRRDDSQFESLPESTRTFSNENGRLNASLDDYYRKLAKDDGPIRSGSLSNVCETKSWKTLNSERANIKSEESTSSQSSGICVSDRSNRKSTTSFASLTKPRDPNISAINIVYKQHEKQDGYKKPLQPSLLQKSKQDRRTTFAALPNTTTWQQQRVLSSNSSQADSGHETPNESNDPSLNIQLANIRMKLEEKRRKIELEKKRIEVLWKKQRQKLGKVAFLQAVSRTGGTELETPDSGTGKEVEETEIQLMPDKFTTSSPSLVRRMSMQEIAQDLDSVQKKWLEKNEVPVPFPAAVNNVGDNDVDDADISPNDLQASIEQLNSSLHNLQVDISRITIQQEHVENLMQDSVEDMSHFFLHGHSDTSNVTESPVKTWNRDSYQVSNTFSDTEHSLSMSPQKHLNHSELGVQRKMPSYSHNQPLHDYSKDINLDELYSKVVKPQRPQDYSLPDYTSANTRSRYPKGNLESPSRTLNLRQQHDSRRVPVLKQEPSTPELPPKKYSTGKEQRFSISFDGQPTKSTTKWQRLSTNKVQECKKESDTNSFGFVIGADLVHPDPETEVEMAKKKEMIMNLSIKRRTEHETQKMAKELEIAQSKEEEQRKKEYNEKKKEEERQRRQLILEQYRQRKRQEELEKEGAKDTTVLSRTHGAIKSRSSTYLSQRKDSNRICSDFTKPLAELRNHVALQNKNRTPGKPRPKSAFITTTSSNDAFDGGTFNKRNSQFLSSAKGIPEFDLDSLNSTNTSSSHERGRSPSNQSGTCPTSPNHDGGLRPPCHSSDGASDTTSNSSNVAMGPEYTGPKLFVKPTAKSNRGIITNAINTVLAGAVNSDTKKKVSEVITKSESKHFLILFRDAGCQFRALYSYNPDTDEVIKLYGIGPKMVSDKMMERFYKYNSGGKCFSEVHTKHLTVTIDAFTIPNSLWAGRKVIPQRKDLL